ncbi:MAG: outer membrane beta-barrel protein [Elusimicrobiales bacterium]
MKRLLAAIVMIAGVGAVATAADVGKWDADYGVGYAMPVSGDWSSNHKGSLNMSLAGAYKFQDMLSAGLELGYDFGHKNKDVSDYKVKVLQLTPFIKADKDVELGGKKVNTYGIFGLGLYRWSTPDYDNGAGTTVAGDSGSKFGFNLGGGAMMEVAPQWKVGLDLRWHHVFGMLDNGDGTSSAANNIVPSLKVAYSF